MKLVSFLKKDNGVEHAKSQPPQKLEQLSRYGWMEKDHVIDAVVAETRLVSMGVLSDILLPTTLLKCLEEEVLFERLRLVYEKGTSLTESIGIPLPDAQLLSPLPYPSSVRDFYSFEQHVKIARARRGLEMVPEWYHFPVFYFSNHQAVIGPDAEVPIPAATKAMDFELEIACVIRKAGKDIDASNAMDHIAGFMIMNDWSARDIQREEVKVGLGPAKGKDFATSLGPFLITPDELSDAFSNDRHDLSMVARVNGKEYSRGNAKDLYWSFAQMIQRASADCWLYPGDVIGSGTVGTGCILEWGTERFPWLGPGDIVELEIERLGVLRNKVIG